MSSGDRGRGDLEVACTGGELLFAGRRNLYSLVLQSLVDTDFGIMAG